MSQEHAFAMINQGHSCFITGPGGVGKTYVIQNSLNNHSVLCAPTGIAALNVGGETCHSVFGLPFNIPEVDDQRKIGHKLRNLFSSGAIKTIQFDEIGMIRADMFDLMDKKMRFLTRKNIPFGGLQILAFGDFFQLAPVLTNSDKYAFGSFGYKSPYCFDSHVWKELDLKPIALKKVYRQSDEAQIKILNMIRTGADGATRLIPQFNRLKGSATDPNILTLCCYNASASMINEHWYEQIDSKEHVFNATKTGKMPVEPVDEVLKLKAGTKVLLCANTESFKNGSRGVIVGFGSDHITVELESGEVVAVEKYTWENKESEVFQGEVNSVRVGAFTQYPIKMGWAVTVHKSQGMTLEAACLDVGRGCFSPGQLYVALSRLKDLKNLTVATDLTNSDLMVSDRVKNYYSENNLL